VVFEDSRGESRSVTVPDDDRPQGLLATWAQIKAHFWLRRRVGYGLTLRNVSMQFDLARWLRSIPAVAAVVLLVVCGGAYIFSVIRPAGKIGGSRLVMDRVSGRKYVNANGLLYPVLNEASAKLIVGMATEPVGVRRAAIAGRPQGPTVGIAGAPDEMPVTNGPSTAVAVCQKVPLESVAGHVMVAVLDGGVVFGSRADRMGPLDAIVGTLNGQTWVIWGGKKSVVDPNDRIVLSALGIDRDVLNRPVPLTPAFANAVPSGLPLVDPAVPDAGMPAPWSLGRPLSVGAVVQSALPGRGQRFYLVLKDGVQEVSPTVAAMLRSENAFGAADAPVVDPDALAKVPQVTVVQTSQYPPAPVDVLSAQDKPVTCWTWEKGRTASNAAMAVVAGTELPIAAAADALLSPVVGAHDGATVADAVYMAPDAANWVRTTGNSQSSSSQESYWWLAPSGSRFGVNSADHSRESLGLPDVTLPMPWSVLRLFPSGLPPHVELSKADAMAQHENVPNDPAPSALVPSSER
jgi:type VII secretion protein EccB